jgi:hypothetical protein
MKEITDKALEVIGRLTDFVEPDNIVIGGGMARDIILDRPIKDIDLIVYGGADKSVTIKRAELGLKNLGLMLLSGTNAYSKRDDKSNFLVYGLGPRDSKTEADVQAIVTKVKPLKFIEETFDIGLCQAAIDTDGRFLVSEWFKNDARNHKLTLLVRDTITPYQIGYSIKEHVPRLQKKYDYDFEVAWGVKPADTLMQEFKL